MAYLVTVLKQISIGVYSFFSIQLTIFSFKVVKVAPLIYFYRTCGCPKEIGTQNEEQSEETSITASTDKNVWFRTRGHLKEKSKKRPKSHINKDGNNKRKKLPMLLKDDDNVDEGF